VSVYPALLFLAALNLHVTSGGKPTVARVYIADTSGKPYRIPNTAGYSRLGEVHSIVDGAATVPLPPGKYSVRAEKGAEFTGVEKSIEIGAEPVSIDLDIPRFFNMNAAGWYSGDLHIHRSPEEMPLLMRAEELNVGPTITRHVGGTRGRAAPFPQINAKLIDATHVMTLQNQEVERLFKGHGAVILLNMPEPVEDKLGDLYPMDIEFCRRARSQGGFVDGEKPIWKNVPVNVAFEALDTIGVVNNHFHPHDTWVDAEKYGAMERDNPEYNTVAGFAQWMMDLYYSFLNCGFRIPVSAGSASGVMPSWIGYERVYVRLSGPFSYEQWFRDLKAGRSIATNGPLLQVAVNGKPPGAEFEWKESFQRSAISGQLLSPAAGRVAAQASLSIEVHSQEPIDRIEVVFNGNVILTPKGSKAVVTVQIPGPGWLAVRCFGPAGEAIRYAHSSPFYFLKNGKLPVKKADAERWAAYIHKLAAEANRADYPSQEAYDKTQATFREAERVYRNRVE
jgi:hypothetical protein